MEKYIERSNHGKGFRYSIDGVRVDRPTVSRIASMAIPPAWTNVQISVSQKAKIQATGYDAKGRKQYIYSQAHSRKQQAAKFDRIVNFASHLPTLRRRVQKDLKRWRFDKRKVIAAAVSLMDEGYFRVGNEAYARTNKSYGLTTLRSKHVTVKSDKVIFDFTGKSGQRQHKVIRDNEIARIVGKLDDMPGYELFRYYDKNGALHNLTAADVNEYLKANMGSDYSAKDFRTWGGTMLAALELARQTRAGTKAARKKATTDCVKRVAKKLGNTPAIARSSYIDPRVFEAYDNSDGIHEVYKTVQNMKPGKYLSNDERWVLELLSK